MKSTKVSLAGRYVSKLEWDNMQWYGLEKVEKYQSGIFFFFLIVVDFVIHRNESAMGLHVFPIPIPPPTSLSTRSL